MSRSSLILDGQSLTLTQLAQFDRTAQRVALAPGMEQKLAVSRAVVERAASEDTPTYGINTGFGAFANRKIAADKLDALQLNLVRSHAAGVGEPLDAKLTRRLILLKANGLL